MAVLCFDAGTLRLDGSDPDSHALAGRDSFWVRSIPLEIAGFWTDDYWTAKLDTLRTFRARPILVAVPVDRAVDSSDLPSGVIRYRKDLQVRMCWVCW